MPKSTISLKISKQQGEKALSLTSKLGIIDKALEIGRDESNLFIPLIRKPNTNDLSALNQLQDYQLATTIFAEKEPPAKTLMQTLGDMLPPHLFASLPQSLDIVGDIAIIEIPPELKTYENIIGEAILKMHKNIRTVLEKAGAVGGTYRLREFNFMAGENKTKTVHREFGCQFHVDVAKSYFSPRLSHEHQRVASLIERGETIVDLFAGVGPFSVLIAKRNSKVKIYAVDINPDAFEMLKVNVRVNRVENRVFPILGDSRQLAAKKLKGLADRLIMNLPETAIEFVDVACQAIKPQGGIIHFYAFVRSPDSIENLKKRLSQVVEQNARKAQAFVYDKSIRETAPHQSQVVLDVRIS
jgi:tRNA (guanine37-N1)-methyltransferase